MAPVALHDAEVLPEAMRKRTKVFVVGLGMVGVAFIEKLLNWDIEERYCIETVSEEPHLAYNRVALTEYFEHRDVNKLLLNSPEWYAEQRPDRFAFHVGEQVLSIDPDRKEVLTSKGNTYSYDVCVIATGSNAAMPPYVSTDRARHTKGVFVYRNISDIENMIAYAQQPEVNKVAVVGGGLLGLEAAKAVYDMPEVADVSIVIRQSYPLNRQLDAPAGELVLKKIESLGVKVFTNCEPKAIVTETEATGQERFTGFALEERNVDFDMCIFAIGISPRDDLAAKANIKLAKRGGIAVNDFLQTSVPDIYAIGECASWNDNTYGLIAPGIEMADILAFNLTQTDSHAPRKMNNPDLSTSLKLMGVNVASFGDFFADERLQRECAAAETSTAKPGDRVKDATVVHKSAKAQVEEVMKSLTYLDPFSSTYKKFIFTADGKHLLGGILVGDVAQFTKLVAVVKKKKKLDVSPSEFIVGAKKDEDDSGADLDDDTIICSCHAVSKGAIGACVKDGITDLAAIKSKTKAGSGCGGCVPLVTNIFKAQMRAAGHAVNNNLCMHFQLSRMDLFQVIKVKKLKDFATVMSTVGVRGDSVGCEICKPAIANILASLWNEHVMKTSHHHSQDTNDRFLANIQRNGTFSVVPRMAAGEVTPDGLIAIGKIAKEHGLYTKITGGQRIDLFGARREDLPDIWQKLVEAGFESGHAYGKSLRTVKSCVGTSWCRFGVGDSVGLAVALENRYRGVRSAHKLKGGVSGCTRECAEAQSKDFGLIATDKGWNIYVGGNGGTNPRHARLLASDVPPTHVVRILDRYLMYYIQTADRLVRTAPWLESLEGGIEKLRRVIIDDELGICQELDALMDNLVGTYVDEWAAALKDPAIRSKFRQFSNTDERRETAEKVHERGQARYADWAKAYPTKRFSHNDLLTPRERWDWVSLAKVSDLTPTEKNTTSIAVLYGKDTQLSIFHVPGRGYLASQRMCPHKNAFVLDMGIVGDDKDGNLYVSCPLHKRNYRLDNGDCTNDAEYKIMTFDVKAEGESVLVLLPPADEMDAVLGTSRHMIKQATADQLGKFAATSIELVAPNEDGPKPSSPCASTACGSNKLEW